MGVGVHGDPDRGMAQHGGDNFSRYGVSEHQGGVCVPQVVKTDGRERSVLQQLFKAVLQDVGADRGAV